MNALETEFLVACELHDPVRLREVLDAGLDVRLPIQRRSAVDWLLSMDTRTDQLPQCVRLLIHDGANVMGASPWLILFPAGALSITLYCANFIGDGLRDALDPKDR